MKMADFGRGIKAGVAAGGIYIVISVVLAAIGHRFWYPSDFLEAAGLGIPLGLTGPSFVIDLILVFIVPHIVRGIVFGAVFAALYSFLPGTTSVKKGVVFSSFLWIVAVIQAIYTTPGWAWHADGFSGSGTYYSGMISLSSAGRALAGIISALGFGALTGFLWNGFRGKGLTEARKGSPVLLVSFILGGLMWVLPAIGFIIGVIIRGAPLIEPGPLGWYGVLYASVVFIGLPGWVLALVAWRKTRRGESGFKWGMAGGIIMALTGHMLLPGVLSIIGGVYSRRKPASEPSTAETGQLQ
jgi:hypothetical protein